MGGFKNRDIKRNEPKNPTTLADLTAENMEVFCWCNRCNHNAEVATSSLISRLGPLFPVPELGSLMRCSACNTRDIATRPAWQAMEVERSPVMIDPKMTLMCHPPTDNPAKGHGQVTLDKIGL